jgi:predicted nucleic acid-binding protein
VRVVLDTNVLVAALASHASIVVSGDKDLLRVSGWQGIVVLTPRQFHDSYLGVR